MKDNYSWLDKVQTEFAEFTVSLDDQAKQTIISQLEIEKLRARIDEWQQVRKANLDNGFGTGTEDKRITDLTEKLKELEG